MASVVYGLILEAKGDVKRIKLKDATNKTPLTTTDVQKFLKKKTVCEQLGTYVYGQYDLTLFGYTSGKAGTENKHELPPPFDEPLYFGDILLLASKKNTAWSLPVSFTPEQYEIFYQKAFGGFEELGDEDEEEEIEEEEEVEETEEVEDHVLPIKKKTAEETGIPEDDVVIEEDEEQVDEDEEEEEEEEEEEDEEIGEGGDGGEECDEVVPVKPRTSSKKKPIKTNLTVAQNTGRARQQTLLMQAGLEQIEDVRPIPSKDSQQVNETH